MEVGKREDRRAFVAAVRDVEARSVAIRSHRDELFRRSDVGGVEDDPFRDRTRFRVDRDHGLRLSQADVDDSVRADREAARLALDGPAADDFLIASRNGNERRRKRVRSQECRRRGEGEQQKERELTPRVCRRSFR